jgi:uncharacterized phage protein gp47/JayE
MGLTILLRRSFEKVAARSLAGLAHTLFGYLKFIEKQAFPNTAEEEYLDQQGGIWGVARKPATFAEFTATVTGTAGVTIPVNRVYRRADGREYSTQAAVTLPGTITLVAVLAGKEAEVEVGDSLSILSPIAGLDSEAVVASIITEPEDAEDDASYQARIVDRIQNPPSGGTATDYRQWAVAVPGITRAWVMPGGLGPGTVVVYAVSDDETPITPSPAKLTEVFDSIAEVKPVTADVSVVAPVLFPIALTVALKPNTADVQAAVTAELQDMIRREAAVTGTYKSPGVTHDGKILVSKIREAISIALGEGDHSIVSVNGGAVANVSPPTGNLAVLGAITWQTLA